LIACIVLFAFVAGAGLGFGVNELLWRHWLETDNARLRRELGLSPDRRFH
jgi:hypothetical protein